MDVKCSLPSNFRGIYIKTKLTQKGIYFSSEIIDVNILLLVTKDCCLHSLHKHGFTLAIKTVKGMDGKWSTQWLKGCLQ